MCHPGRDVWPRTGAYPPLRRLWDRPAGPPREAGEGGLPVYVWGRSDGGTHSLAFSPQAANVAVSSIRTCSRLRPLGLHDPLRGSARRADRLNPSQCALAPGLARRAASRSSGTTRSSTASSNSHVPRRFASSIAATPAGSIRPAAVRRSIRSLLGRDQPLRGRRGVNHQDRAFVVDLPGLRVDPTDAAGPPSTASPSEETAGRPVAVRHVTRYAPVDVCVICDQPGTPRRAIERVDPRPAIWGDAFRRRHPSRLPGVQVTIPIGIGRCPTRPACPSASISMSDPSAARKRASAADPGSTQSCRRRNPSSSGRANRRGSRSSRSIAAAAMRAQKFDELAAAPAARHGPRRGPAASTRPRSTTADVHQDRDAQAPRRDLHRREERPDGLDVVADVGDERDVGAHDAGGGGQRPSTTSTLSMPYSVASSRAPRASRRRIEGDDAAARRGPPGDRQRVTAGARADVQPVSPGRTRRRRTSRVGSSVRSGRPGTGR